MGESYGVTAFAGLTGHAPDSTWSAPGRVNLIGEHTDYNEGLVLPVTIDRRATVSVGVRADRRVRCLSAQLPGEVVVDLDRIAPGQPGGWAAHPLGVVWAMDGAGVTLPGLDVVIDSAVPVGAGLASSAAVEVALARAVAEVCGITAGDDAVARWCQAGEEAIAGAPTGLMDPLAVLAGGAGHALFLDCASLARELVPFRPEDHGATVLVIDTGVAHATAGAGYRSRRAECVQAAARLGVRSLREATLAEVRAQLSGVLERRARHVVSENGRVGRAVELLRAGKLAALGPLLDESHASLRGDFEVSCPELDLAVEVARDCGAWGARMTGAGFGGSAIALLPSGRVDAAVDGVRGAFAHRGLGPPAVFAVVTAPGARRED